MHLQFERRTFGSSFANAFVLPGGSLQALRLNRWGAGPYRILLVLPLIRSCSSNERIRSSCRTNVHRKGRHDTFWATKLRCAKPPHACRLRAKTRKHLSCHYLGLLPNSHVPNRSKLSQKLQPGSWIWAFCNLRVLPLTNRNSRQCPCSLLSVDVDRWPKCGRDTLRNALPSTSCEDWTGGGHSCSFKQQVHRCIHRSDIHSGYLS